MFFENCYIDNKKLYKTYHKINLLQILDDSQYKKSDKCKIYTSTSNEIKNQLEKTNGCENRVFNSLLERIIEFKKMTKS